MTEAKLRREWRWRRMLEFVGGLATDRRLKLFAYACCRRVWNSLLPAGRDAVAVAERVADATAADGERVRVFEALTIAAGGTWLPHSDGRHAAFIDGTDRGSLAVALAIMADTEWLFDTNDGRPFPCAGRPTGRVGRIHESCHYAACLAATRAIMTRTVIQGGLVRRVWGQVSRSVGRVLDEFRARDAWDREYDRECGRQQALFPDIFENLIRPVTLDPRWLTSDVVTLAQGIYDDRAFDRMPILADALQDAGCENDDLLTHCCDSQLTHVRGCWVVDLVLGKS